MAHLTSYENNPSHSISRPSVPRDPCPWKIGLWEVGSGTSKVTAFNSEELERSRTNPPRTAIRFFSSRRAQIEADAKQRDTRQLRTISRRLRHHKDVTGQFGWRIR